LRWLRRLRAMRSPILDEVIKRLRAKGSEGEFAAKLVEAYMAEGPRGVRRLLSEYLSSLGLSPEPTGEGGQETD